MGADLVRALEHLGEREMPDRLALAGDSINVVLEAEALLLCELADPIGDELAELFSGKWPLSAG